MAAFYSGDRVDAVVVDIGAGSTKMGWAGDDYPRSYFRSVREQANTVPACMLAHALASYHIDGLYDGHKEDAVKVERHLSACK